VSEIKLAAQPRTEFGKGAARRLRRANQIPAVLYGHGADPVHVALPGHATMLALKHSNALLSLDIEGKIQLALPKDVQRDPVRNIIEHVDLLLVRKGEKVTVDVPLQFTGDTAPGTRVQAELNSLTVEVEATHIPQSIEVSLAGAESGFKIHAGEVTLPQGASLGVDAELLVASVFEIIESAEATEEAAPAEGAAAGAPAEA
jgi:large subunit ribosomal protein L25